ncbi:MAG TPA: class I SAM-dependent methyltransferase [Gemmatales bacterium]|nr:class I SAM-dependent methyltransferase [Gemmatales bacterium]HMP60138.1 class I SAM-dependent methyltransferase [Gemmatales bacterium]
MTTPAPQERFTGLAEPYARYRPGFPPAAYDFIAEFAGLATGALVLDVGFGTGISAQPLAERGWQVIGIEPNDDMLRTARQTLPSKLGIRLIQAAAEQVPLPDASADAIVAAQAFHWFRPTAALAEFHRLLKPGGSLFLMWYERADGDPFNDAYTAAIHRHGEGAADLERQRRLAGTVLLQAPGWDAACRHEFTHEQRLDEEGVVGRARSISYGPKSEAGLAALAADLKAAFQHYHQGGTVAMKYITTLYAARRPER